MPFVPEQPTKVNGIDAVRPAFAASFTLTRSIAWSAPQQIEIDGSAKWTREGPPQHRRPRQVPVVADGYRRPAPRCSSSSQFELTVEMATCSQSALELSGEEDEAALEQGRVTWRSLAPGEWAELAAVLRGRGTF